jgi:hypothetical protein
MGGRMMHCNKSPIDLGHFSRLGVWGEREEKYRKKKRALVVVSLWEEG